MMSFLSLKSHESSLFTRIGRTIVLTMATVVIYPMNLAYSQGVPGAGGGGASGGDPNWVVTTSVVASSQYSDTANGNGPKLGKALIATQISPHTYATVTVNAQYTVSARWVGTGAMPSTVTLAVTPVAQWDWKPTNQLIPELATAFKCDDSFADPENPVVVGNVTDETDKSTKTHLFTVAVDPTSGIATLGLQPMLSRVTVNTSLGGSLTASCTVAAAIDDRTVFIISDVDATQNYQKASDGSRVQNVRNPDGSMTIDTVASGKWDYYYPKAPSDPGGEATSVWYKTDWIFGTGLTAVTTGFDLSLNAFGHIYNTSASWSKQNEAAQSSIDYSIFAPLTASASVEDQLEPKLANLPCTYTAKVHVEDVRPGMEAVADNTYVIRLHQAIENEQLISNIPGEHFSYPHYDHEDLNSFSAWTGRGTTLTIVLSRDGGTYKVEGLDLQFLLSGILGSGAIALLPYGELAGATVSMSDIIFNVLGNMSATQVGIPDPTTTVVSGDASTFEYAVEKQKLIYTDMDLELSFPASYADIDMHLHDNVDAPQVNRFPQLTETSFATLSSQVPNWDTFFNNYVVMFRAADGLRYMMNASIADKYRADGYAGKTYLTGVKPIGNFGQPVTQWQLSPGAFLQYGITSIVQ